MEKIRKRDGRIVKFDRKKIETAIWKAAYSVGGKNREKAKELAKEVEEILDQKFKNKIPTVEDVQNLVEKTLVENGHYATAKAYILYREKHKNIRDLKNTLANALTIMEGYLSQRDWRTKENANTDYSFQGLSLHAAGYIISTYTLNYIYPPQIGKAHIEGDFHIHDLSHGIGGYCAGWSLHDLLKEGFNGVKHKVSSKPAKHFRSALGQIVNFLGTMQNEWAGAQALSSFDTYLAPFIRYDGLNYKQIKQALQEFMFSINTTSRWGGQTPFTNITLDWTVPEDLKNKPIIIGGEYQSQTYADYQEEMDLLNKAFIELSLEGDAQGRVFTFPIPTYNITKEFDWDSENVDLLFKMTAKYGIPYFQNFVNSDLKPGDVRSMCCRLQLDLKKLRKKTGALFGSGEKTGSVGVVTINLPRIGFLSKNEDEFFERLERFMYLAKESLEIKRRVVSKNMERGLFPHSKRYLGSLENHFSTIGLVGMHEALINLFGQGIQTKEGHAFAIKVLDFMRARIEEYQEETGNLYNLEATPAEGTSYRLARIDKKKFKTIYTSGAGNGIYYTNSTQLPVNYTDDLYFTLTHQEPLQTRYTGGTVVHMYLGESINYEAAKTLIKRVTKQFRIPYYTITPTFSICQNHGYIKGEAHKCPLCGAETEVYSRIVGYLRPVKQWHEGKQREFQERKTFEKSIHL